METAFLSQSVDNANTFLFLLYDMAITNLHFEATNHQHCFYCNACR
jgi:hypothetical protein